MRKNTFILLLFLFSFFPSFCQETFKLFRDFSTSEKNQINGNIVELQQKQKLLAFYEDVKIVRINNLYDLFENSNIEIPINKGFLTLEPKDYTTVINDTGHLELTINSDTSNGSIYVDNYGTYGYLHVGEKKMDLQSVGNSIVLLKTYNNSIVDSKSCPSSSTASIDTLKNTPENSEKISNPDIDVMVLYTPAVTASGIDVTQLINTARGQWNTAAINSSIQPGINVVHTQEFNLIEDDINLDIALFATSFTAQNLRNVHNADLVILLTNGNYNFSGVVREIGPIEEDAYAIVEIGAATANFTFIHEIGHLFGARHDSLTDTTPGDAHAHIWDVDRFLGKKRYRSVMSIIVSDNRERVLHFSNPARNHLGKATGVINTKHNSRSINANASIIAGFRETAPQITVNILGPASANDGDNLSFTGTISNGQAPYSHNWEADTGSGYYTVGSSTTLSFTMPVDDDLYVRYTASGSDGQSASKTRFVRNLNENGGCSPCPDTRTAITREDLLVYPNPSAHLLTLETLNSKEISAFQIFNIYGVNVTSEVDILKMDLFQLKIIIDRLKTGVYFIKLNNNETVIQFAKK